jgi:hypothetical protein
MIKARVLLIVVCSLLAFTAASVSAQSKPSREMKVGYPLGGSTGFFWVARIAPGRSRNTV